MQLDTSSVRLCQRAIAIIATRQHGNVGNYERTQTTFMNHDIPTVPPPIEKEGKTHSTRIQQVENNCIKL